MAASVVPQRAGSYTPQVPQPRPNLTDDYERWYTEASPNNRMLLALRSGIDTEVTWALDRLCRLCNNEQFLLRAIPGLTDALFEWPDWYVNGGAEECTRMATLFSLPPELELKRRYALESLFVLRNAALNQQPNADELAGHPRTRTLVLTALHRVRPRSDTTMEFMLYIIELFQAVSPALILPPPQAPALANPITPLQEILAETSNRSIIIACLATLELLMTNPLNAPHLHENSPALEVSLRILPLAHDKVMLDAAVNYLYVHLAYPPMTKAFLLHPKMPATLRLLVSVLLSEQVEETVTFEIGGPVHTAPPPQELMRNHELTKDELDRIISLTEPERCFEWKTMFVSNPDGELTQVDFWSLYKDTFTPYQDREALLVASEVIKNVTLVFQNAQAMVLPGPPQRFIVRGVDRRKDDTALLNLKCMWSECVVGPLASTGALYEHVLEEHINPTEGSEATCKWATCNHPAMPKPQLRTHVLTHLPSSQQPPRDPSQSDVITLPSEGFPHPVPDPTTRPPPPPRTATVSYKRPTVDPPSSSLTALLCIRALFRASFASSDAAPRVDEDHFGFPGIIEAQDDAEADLERSGGTDSEKEGERRGRKAFVGIRHLLEGVRVRNETLMGWITEMVDAGITGTTS
ncbi:hypothetical protein CERSUDRAFT_147324 [Gelatoporia subvermispora B]|uniref:RFX-type winged-helix domain-containing protein n=1 Tax=Ceriporiopsis subvermispora (strain B) TaxID=914234 RepID=M2RSN4_CERS8|nr:hypothetical protein CERSUDRAFT_147324 [Gelatoporia subvermispora B]